MTYWQKFETEAATEVEERTPARPPTAELLRAGLVRWRNPGAPAQGMSLTPAGRAVLRGQGRACAWVRGPC